MGRLSLFSCFSLRSAVFEDGAVGPSDLFFLVNVNMCAWAGAEDQRVTERGTDEERRAVFCVVFCVC